MKDKRFKCTKVPRLRKTIMSNEKPVRGTIAILGAAAVAVAALGPIRHAEIPGLFTIPMGAFAVPMTILWIAGLTNVYNFMDGIDGIAG